MDTSRFMSRVFCLLVLTVMTTVLLGGAKACAEDEGYTFNVVDSDGVYFGEGEHPRAPATIVADDVWAAIPEYKKIVDEDLSDDDPRYHLLMKKATERFQKALAKVAKRESYDMIGEDGSIESAGDIKREIPNATKDMVDAVSRD